jgi:hypothetical protein
VGGGVKGAIILKNARHEPKHTRPRQRYLFLFPPPTQIGAFISKVWQKYFFFSFLPLDHNKHLRYFMISRKVMEMNDYLPQKLNATPLKESYSLRLERRQSYEES